MKDESDFDSRVKRANKFFYDTVADIYEDIDGRRTEDVILWLGDTLKGLSEKTSGEALLDFGCGSGVIMRSGKKYFRRTYGMDISPKILEVARDVSSDVFCGDGSAIPLEDNSVDVIVCFAVLHHIYDHRPLFKEAYRVLKKGGILYTDHDMDVSFSKRFRFPLKIYRYVFDAGKKYMRAKKEITEELYKLSEIHSEGINSDMLISKLQREGFKDVTRHYHWFGLSRVFNLIMKHRKFSRGLAPLVSIEARK